MPESEMIVVISVAWSLGNLVLSTIAPILSGLSLLHEISNDRKSMQQLIVLLVAEVLNDKKTDFSGLILIIDRFWVQLKIKVYV